jgi:glycosyltransferase involved in cell wall biosynthesis
MRVLWHSVSPLATTGYGNATRELTRRIRDLGHFVRIGTKHGVHKWYEHDGFEIFDGVDTTFVNQMLEDENFDFVFTMWDLWVIHDKRQYPKGKWVASIPVDTEWISASLVGVSKNVGMPVAMSLHGKRELEAGGVKDVQYAPLGFDEKIFQPLPEARAAFRKELGLTDENFVIGSVGLNYSDDRKGYIQLLMAFKAFHERHPEARLFLHTAANERDTIASGINYHKVVVHLGLKDLVYWPDQAMLIQGRIDPGWLAEIYNGFDVFCLPSKGEGFGLPLIEAQGCGIPVVTTNSTTGPELCKTGWLIDVDGDDRQWIGTETWRLEPRPSNIDAALERAHAAWRSGAWAGLKADAPVKVAEYSWDAVWERYWLPLLAQMEARLRGGAAGGPHDRG